MLLMLVLILDCLPAAVSGLINSGDVLYKSLRQRDYSTHNKETPQLLLRKITQLFSSFVRCQQDIEITLEVKHQTAKRLELRILYVEYNSNQHGVGYRYQEDIRNR